MSKPHITHQTKGPITYTQPRVINLTKIKFTPEQMEILNIGPQYALEEKPSTYINELIIETENTIKKNRSQMAKHVQIPSSHSHKANKE